MFRSLVRTQVLRRVSTSVSCKSVAPAVSFFRPSAQVIVRTYAYPAHVKATIESTKASDTQKNAPQRLPYYTRAEVSRHNHEDDCWLIIHGKVYNVTEWIPKHPGGEIILAHAGADSTSLFESMNSHSSDARKMMDAYLIGELDPKEAPLRNDLSGADMPSPDFVVFDKF